MTHSYAYRPCPFLLLLLACCDATETGGDLGPPQAPTLYDASESNQEENLPQVFEVLAEHRPCGLRWTFDGASEILSIDSFEWTQEKLTEYARDNYAANTVDYRASFVLDTAGRVVSEVWKEGNNPIINTSKLRTYSEGDHLAEVLVDRRGVFWRRQVYDYNSEDQLETVEEYAADQSLYQRVTRVYDTSGFLESELHDFAGDGDINFRFEYQHSQEGLLLSERYDYDNDGYFSEERFYDWSDDGRRLGEQRRYDGSTESDTSYEYDSNGRLAGLQYLHVGTGAPWSAEVLYECDL